MFNIASEALGVLLARPEDPPTRGPHHRFEWFHGVRPSVVCPVGLMALPRHQRRTRVRGQSTDLACRRPSLNF